MDSPHSRLSVYAVSNFVFLDSRKSSECASQLTTDSSCAENDTDALAKAVAVGDAVTETDTESVPDSPVWTAEDEERLVKVSSRLVLDHW